MIFFFFFWCLELLEPVLKSSTSLEQFQIIHFEKMLLKINVLEYFQEQMKNISIQLFMVHYILS